MEVSVEGETIILDHKVPVSSTWEDSDFYPSSSIGEEDDDTSSDYDPMDQESLQEEEEEEKLEERYENRLQSGYRRARRDYQFKETRDYELPESHQVELLSPDSKYYSKRIKIVENYKRDTSEILRKLEKLDSKYPELSNQYYQILKERREKLSLSRKENSRYYLKEAERHGYEHAQVILQILENQLRIDLPSYLNAHESWRSFFDSDRGFTSICEEIESLDITPRIGKVFRIFETPLDSIRVVIIGQDPYPTPGEADGYAFSSQSDHIPRSLQNIRKEILSEYPNLAKKMSGRADLSCWVKQGVLLLNTALTTAPGKIGAHYSLWGDFSQQVLDHAVKHRNRKISGVKLRKKLILVAWGLKAQQFAAKAGEKIHLIQGTHPSPQAANRGFFGCGHFLEINRILREEYQEKEIDWRF